MMDANVSDSRSLPPAIDEWLAALCAKNEDEAVSRLKRAYELTWPSQAEVVFTADCPFACQHCIYPPTYAKDNAVLSSDRWIPALVRLQQHMALSTFVYSGRSMPADGAELLISLRSKLPRARIGVIDNGISMVPHMPRLAEARLDWIDVSLDGMEREHDLQRGRAGSFRAAVKGLAELRHRELSPRLNILTCLTDVNRKSVPAMIRFLNRDGYRSFFITPVVVVPGIRPLASLKPTSEAFLHFVGELLSVIGGLEDAYVEVGLFETEWPTALLDSGKSFKPRKDHLLLRSTSGSSELNIRYYPGSLVGAREIVLNSNGDRLYPKSMAHGRIPLPLRQANIIRSDLHEDHRRMIDRLEDTPYMGELRRERDMLGTSRKENSSWATSTPALAAAVSR